MTRAMRTGALLVALVVLAGYWAGAAAKKHEHHAPAPAPEAHAAPFTYSPAAEVLVQQAKAPGADGGAYINAAKQEVDQIVTQVEGSSTPGEAANLEAAKTAASGNPNNGR